MKWTWSRGLVQLGMCCLEPCLSIQLSLNMMHQPCATLKRKFILNKERRAVTVFQPTAVSVFIPSPGQGLHVGQRLPDEEIPVVQHFQLWNGPALTVAYSHHLPATIHFVVTLPSFLNKQRIRPEPTDTFYASCVKEKAPFALSPFPPCVFAEASHKDSW